MRLFIDLSYKETESAKRRAKIHLVSGISTIRRVSTGDTTGYRYVYLHCGHRHIQWTASNRSARSLVVFDDLEKYPDNQLCRACLNALYNHNRPRKKHSLIGITVVHHSVENGDKEKTLVRRILHPWESSVTEIESG